MAGVTKGKIFNNTNVVQYTNEKTISMTTNHEKLIIKRGFNQSLKNSIPAVPTLK
jgi:hypothetical protein